MKVGLPKGLLYHKYNTFFRTFFEELGEELIISEDTNKRILDEGTKNCVNEACLPIKVFHGHVASIKNQCDLILIPRIMKINCNCFICPHLCSLPEMIIHSIKDMPKTSLEPIYFNDRKKLWKWSFDIGKLLHHSRFNIEKAFTNALTLQLNANVCKNQKGFIYNILLIGHTYLLHDPFINMNLIDKLNKLNIGVITSDALEDDILLDNIKELPRKPFWYHYIEAYGSAKYYTQHKTLDGIIMLSSFGCGSDSIIFEVISQDIKNIPLMMLRVDEHTADAGLDTRLEAFVDMIGRSETDDIDFSSLR